MSAWANTQGLQLPISGFTIFFAVITEISSLHSPCQLTDAVTYSAYTVPQMWLILESVLAFQTETDTRGNSLVQLANLCCHRDMTFYPLNQHGPHYWNISFEFLSVACLPMPVKQLWFCVQIHPTSFPLFSYLQNSGKQGVLKLGPDFSLIALR